MSVRDYALGEPFNLHQQRVGDDVALRLSGVFGAECSEQFQGELEAALQPQPQRLVLDLRGLTFIDSSGLRMVLQAQAAAQRRGSDFVVVRGRGQVQRTFELGGLEQTVSVVDDDPALADGN